MKKIIIIILLSSAPLIAMQSTSNLDEDEQCRQFWLLANAIIEQNYELAKALLEDGVNPNDPHQFELQPIEYAKTAALAELLVNHGAKIPDDILDFGCTRNDYQSDLLEFYLNKGVKSNEASFMLRQLSTYPKKNSVWKRFNAPAMMELPEYEPEAPEILKNRLEKARLLLRFGANPYALFYTSFGGTALHDAARKKDFHFCKLLIEHETVHQRQFLSFLMCCKRNLPRFYLQKDLLKDLWKQWNILMPKRLLNMKDDEGQTAWAYWEIDLLKPE